MKSIVLERRRCFESICPDHRKILISDLKGSNRNAPTTARGPGKTARRLLHIFHT